MKILLFKLGALGDALMTTPLIRQLRNQYPDARIEYAIGKTSAVALQGNLHVDKIIVFDESVFLKKNVVEFVKLAKKLRKESYTHVFTLDKHWSFGVFNRMIGAKIRVGFYREKLSKGFLTHAVHFSGDKHEIHYYLDLLDTIAKANHEDTQLDFSIDKQDADFAEKFWKENFKRGKVIALLPAGGRNVGQTMMYKRWPTDCYLALVKLLQFRGYQCILVGGPTDKDAESFIVSKISVPSVIGVSLGKSAAVLKRADAVVCNDGGPMHLSSAVNNRIVSIFGPTDPKRFAPLHEQSKYLYKPTLQSPCNTVQGGVASNCPCAGACMRAVTPELVYDTLKRVLDE